MQYKITGRDNNQITHQNKMCIRDRYQSILQSKGEEAARAYLTDYTADFIGATILRWDEMANQYWIESRFGF